MRWGNMWQCEARLLYEANRRALGTKKIDRYIDRLSADSRPIYRTAIF